MTTELKNLYEDLIIDMIREDVLDISSELKQKIKDAPVEKRRAMILTFMEENNTEHRLLCDSIRKIAEHRDRSKSNHIKEIVTMVREYVTVSDTERKLGEVMTPLTLVSDMLDTLPTEVWTNPDLKWLDPCNGVGTFTSVIVERLMEGLKSWEPNDELRYEHIMESMIHVCELQAKNMFLYLYSFDPEDRYAVNVYNGSFLDEGFDRHLELWGITKFDVIVMNPPYQTRLNGAKKPSYLWNKFVTKTIDILTKGGYLSAVHPGGWRNPGGAFKDILGLLKERQITYLNINNYQKGFDTFGVHTDFDFYCVKNSPINGIETKIVDIDEKVTFVNLSEAPFIPKCNIKKVLSLVAKEDDEKIETMGSFSLYFSLKPYMSNEQDDTFKYPCAQNINTKDEVGCVKYSSVQKGHFGIPKVIFGRKNCGAYVDETGEYGLAQHCTAIVDTKENLPHIYRALKNSDFIQNIMGFRESWGDKYNYRIIATFRKDFWKEFI